MEMEGHLPTASAFAPAFSTSSMLATATAITENLSDCFINGTTSCDSSANHPVAAVMGEADIDTVAAAAAAAGGITPPSEVMLDEAGIGTILAMAPPPIPLVKSEDLSKSINSDASSVVSVVSSTQSFAKVHQNQNQEQQPIIKNENKYTGSQVLVHSQCLDRHSCNHLRAHQTPSLSIISKLPEPVPNPIATPPSPSPGDGIESDSANGMAKLDSTISPPFIRSNEQGHGPPPSSLPVLTPLPSIHSHERTEFSTQPSSLPQISRLNSKSISNSTPPPSEFKTSEKFTTAPKRSRAKRKRCTFENCNKFAIQGGKCTAHGARRRRCGAEGCEKIAVKGGMCRTHGAGRKVQVPLGSLQEQPSNSKHQQNQQTRPQSQPFVVQSLMGSHDSIPVVFRACDLICTTVNANNGSTSNKVSTSLQSNIITKVCTTTPIPVHLPPSESTPNTTLITLPLESTKRKKCTVQPCQNIAVQGGRCYAHGAPRKRCNLEGCSNIAMKGGRCYSHGARRKRCEEKGCDNIALQGGRCTTHGAKRQKLLSVAAATSQASSLS